MTTIVNTPSSGSSEGSNMGIVIGVIVLLLVLFLLFFYGLPMVRTTNNEQSAPAVQIPEQVDVNINEMPQ